MKPPRRVVVTGTGVACALALDVPEFWSALLDGQSGLATAASEQSAVGAAVVGRVEREINGVYRRVRRHVKVLSRSFHLLLNAAVQSSDDAGFELAPVPTERLGVVIGVGSLEPYADILPIVRAGCGEQSSVTQRLVTNLEPLRRLRHLPNIASSLVSIECRAGGPSLVLTGGDCSGLLALVEGAQMVQEGIVDAVIVGGVDSRLDPLQLSIFATEHALSGDPDPCRSCRPFDADCSGTVAAEGAAILVLESEASAARRGAKSYAALTGVGSVGRYRPDGLTRALRAAVLHEGAGADLVVAHGAGERSVDAVEAAALKAVFCGAQTQPYVTSIKGAIGHTMSAAGAFNAIAACMAIRTGRAPALHSLRTPCADLRFVPVGARNGRIERVICTALEPTGPVVAAVFESEMG